MALFCIPKNQVAKLKDSALKGEIDVKKLYEMSSAERRAFFAKFTDEALAKFLNTEFEKAMISKHQTALLDWAKSVFKPEAQTSPVFKNVVDKINALNELGVLSPKAERAFLEDLVSDRLGIRVSPEEVRIINDKAKKINEAQKSLGTDLGNPAKMQENLDFFKAKKEMDDYLLGLTPGSRLKVTTGTIGRGMMLLSVKSPVLNIGSNIEIGFTEALSRRVATGRLRGADNAAAIEFVKMANKIYQATGYDISRMTSIADTGASGARVLGDTVHSQGPGAIRAAGRVVEDVVFKQLMGAPDVGFSSAHFADSVNLNAAKMFKDDPARAKAAMTDAMRLEPMTPEGEILRAQGILDAQKATWTDKTWAADVSMGIRKILNDVSGDIRLGDYLMPFVKTPANVIATGLDYAGLGIPKAAIKAIRALKNGELGDPHVLQSISRDLIRAGIGLTGAFLISAALKKDDFVGAYDPARAQIEQLRNSNTNSIRIGGKWISTAWLGPLAVPVTAIMYARKYGSTPGEMAFQYGKGTISSFEQLPGVADVFDFVKGQQSRANQNLEGMTGEAGDYIAEQLWSRLVPSFVGDLAKATDKYDRKTGQGAESIKARVPGLRQTLPIKTNIFGEKSEGEAAWSDILFGSRVKTDRETAITRELLAIADATGKGIAFTDWDKSSSATLSQFKEKVGEEKFQEAKVKYGQYLKAAVEAEIAKGSYQALPPEDKLKAINGLDADQMARVFKDYGFKYKPKK